MTKHSFLALITAVVTVGALSIPQPGFAQDRENDGEIEEITVTARFREESVQDIGMSIAAFDQNLIERSGLVEVQDLGLRTAGLDVLDFGPGRNDINIRGVTNALPGGAGLKALSTVFIDDVSVSGFGSGRGTDFNMFDFNRVEVLRGPQPTYFGEGSVGGTVRYFSADPDLSEGFSGALQAGYGNVSDGDDSWRVDSATTIPLIEDELALRVVLYNQEEAGFIDLPVLGVEDANDFEATGGRVVALWEPSDRFTGRFAAHIGRLDYGESYEIDPTQDLSDIGEDNLISQASALASNSDDYDLFTAKLAYRWDNWTLESVTGKFDREVFSGAESSANTVGFRLFLEFVFGVTGIDTRVFASDASEEDTFSQEFRLISNLDGPLNYTAGLYYKDSDIDQVVQLVGEGLSGIVVPNTSLLLDGIFTENTEQSSVFFEVNWDVNDQFRLIGGARYVQEDFTNTLIKNEVIQLQTFLGVDPNTGLPQFPLGSDLELLAGLGLNNSFVFELEEWLPRFGFEYDVSEDLLLYGNVSRGLRNGGLNQIIAAAALALDPNTFEFNEAIFRDALFYSEDEVDSLELGFKSRLKDGAMTFNGAVYVSDYQNPQVLVGVPTALIQNAPDEDIWGLELETAWIINDTWSTFFNLSYLDSEFSDSAQLTIVPTTDPGFQDLREGNIPSNSPEWTFAVGADFEYPLSNGLDLVGHGSYSYVDERFGSVQNFPASTFGSLDILNLRLGVHGENWRVTGYVNNALNDLEKQGTLAPSNAAFVNENGVLDANLSQVFINRPRTFGVNFTLEY